MVTDPDTKSKVLSLSHRLRRRAQEVGGWLCVGLDPQLDRLPAGIDRTPEGVIEFCRRIIEATADLSVAFKINFAFFEALGPDGWQALAAVRDLVPADIPAIADAKRGDIGSTSRAYATAVFDRLGFDAVTVSPYVGWDALRPFFAYSDKGVFVLCRTSNPGAGALQNLRVEGRPLYLEVARQALAQRTRAEIGLVVGATYPEELRAVRALSEAALLLVPGVGAQGADADVAYALASNAERENALIAVSRQILHASPSETFDQSARQVAEDMLEEMCPRGDC
jgi:orotidine-5'-phosphate decarboxylase